MALLFTTTLEFILDYWIYLAIPIISALVGWTTNILALKMTFLPLEFIGIPPYLGWQGIIPSKAAVMAGKSVDLMTQNLLTVEERFALIEPERVMQEMRAEVHRISRRVVDEVMQSQAGLIWLSLPSGVKEDIYANAEKDLPRIIEAMVIEVKSQISELFDLKGMVTSTLTENKQLLNRIFLKSGEEEFKFIERSGLYFGFLFGLVQMIVWSFVQPWWLLPLGGLIIGYATNWLALKLIFHPIEPRRIGFWVVQGIFLKRQKEVAAEYAKIVATDILNPRNIYENLLYGKQSDRFESIIHTFIIKAVEQTYDRSHELIKAITSEKRLAIAKNIAISGVLEDLRLTLHQLYGYTEEALNMENTLRDRMGSLPPRKFQSFLRPVFQEDEFKLILVGAVLGFFAGLLQMYWFLY